MSVGYNAYDGIQIGLDGTATRNFVLRVPASPDGTLKLSRGNDGATTADIWKVNADGSMVFYAAGTSALSISATGEYTFGTTATLDSTNGFLMKTKASIGYGAGSGAVVTQTTDKSTAVTINAPSGVITTHNASLASGAKVYFNVTNSYVAEGDVVLLTLEGAGIAGSSYRCWVDYTYAGHFVVAIENYSGGALAQAATIGFAVIKTSAS